VRGRNPRIIKGDDTSLEEYQALWKTIKSGREWKGEFHNRKKSGERFWEQTTISPVVDTDGTITHFLALKEDITEKKRLEDQLRQAQKLESIGQLAGGVAHDFNNILASMMMRLGIMSHGKNHDEETREALKELLLDTERAANLTRQLPLFSRKSELETKVFDLNELIANLIKMLRRLIGEHISLQFADGADQPPIEADPGMIEQVVMNLLVNARDAMPNGGEIRIRTESVAFQSGQIAQTPGARAGNFICLSIVDTGCGMDERTLSHIFEPFFTTKEAGRGTGLGLATVYGIVTQHKGWVEVESEVGKGATMRVYLPDAGSPLRDTAPKLKENIEKGHETILLVEDDRI
jgi:two-component system, cell cycle sensor histidine kinase and response regulator CckA